MPAKTIKVDLLTRVEGEGALRVKIRNREVVEAQVTIFEPPRFFEAFLRGRAFTEAPDITARICGICPVAYQMSAVHAMEAACGVTVPAPIRALRRLLYCGEWIESHALHMYMLHAPDFLGYPDAIQLARDHPEVVQRALRLKKIGNALVEVVGGRAIHPVNVRVGGFYRTPSRQQLEELLGELLWAREASLQTVRFMSTLPFPALERDYEFVSLCHPEEYPLNEGRVVSSTGLDIPVSAYDRHFHEMHVERSTALHSLTTAGSPYLTGPLARYSLNAERLPAVAREAAAEAGLGPECRNPFQSIVVRAIETLFACDEAVRIISTYEVPAEPAVPVEPRAGIGCAATEAPRGTLYHRYEIDEEGSILSATIVPPTSQNLRTIERDLFLVARANVDLPDDALGHICEQSVRNHDPCISCSTHFLRVDLDRE